MSYICKTHRKLNQCLSFETILIILIILRFFLVYMYILTLRLQMNYLKKYMYLDTKNTGFSFVDDLNNEYEPDKSIDNFPY